MQRYHLNRPAISSKLFPFVSGKCIATNPNPRAEMVAYIQNAPAGVATAGDESDRNVALTRMFPTQFAVVEIATHCERAACGKISLFMVHGMADRPIPKRKRYAITQSTAKIPTGFSHDSFSVSSSSAAPTKSHVFAPSSYEQPSMLLQSEQNVVFPSQSHAG